jgi:hypothetical protein
MAFNDFFFFGGTGVFGGFVRQGLTMHSPGWLQTGDPLLSLAECLDYMHEVP